MSHGDIDSFVDEFNQFLDEIGVWVVYTRSDRRFRCIECFNLDTNDSSSNCGTCFGTGWKTTLERWLTYYSQSLVRAAPADTPVLRPGITDIGGHFVFTRASEIPIIGDKFFVVEWDRPRDEVVRRGAQPVYLTNVFNIYKVEPNIAGKVIYYTCHCEPATEIVKQVEPVLLRTPITISRP